MTVTLSTENIAQSAFPVDFNEIEHREDGEIVTALARDARLTGPLALGQRVLAREGDASCSGNVCGWWERGGEPLVEIRLDWDTWEPEPS